MSAPIIPFDAVLVTALMDALRADSGVRAFFGDPPRLFDDETSRPVFPYAEFVSAETRDFASALTPGGEHRITFAVHVRKGGQAEAAEGLNVLVEAIRAADIVLPGVRIALIHPVYLDVVRGIYSKDRRGLLRLRIVTEPEPSND